MSKALAVLLELKESASYWSEYDVPIGIHERIEEAILELTAKPEPVAWMNDSGGCFLSDGNKYSENWTALYTAPPKREPIEDGELEVWYSQHAWAMDKQEYMWGFRDAEKAHGITGVDDE